MNKKLLGSDYLLLLLYLNQGEPIKGAVRLTKMMFLFNEQIAPKLKEKGAIIEKLPEFIAYNYGPFSKEVYEQVELFSGIGFIKVKDLNIEEDEDNVSNIDNLIEIEYIEEFDKDDNDLKSENKYLQYSIDEKGKNFVEEKIKPELNQEAIELLEVFKKKINEMPVKQLLYYVYSRYPDYTEKSLIKDEVLNNGD